MIGSVIYSLPFVVQPIRNAFEAIGERPLEVAATLRAGPLATLLARRRAARAAGLSDRRGAGLRPHGRRVRRRADDRRQYSRARPRCCRSRSTTMSSALEWGEAHILAAGMVVFAFVVITATMLIDRRIGRVLGDEARNEPLEPPKSAPTSPARRQNPGNRDTRE